MLETVTKEQFLELRKRRIELEYTHLNDMQRKAVLATNGPLLLLAGAGSGKTTVLINRIANLIKFGAGGDSDYIPDYVTDVDAALIYEYIERQDPEIREMVDHACAVNPAAPWSIIAITFTNKAANELKDRLARRIGE
ncbi:MAG: UvrD-helicase domain-containing protein, partial [Clostridia bacterium]|nr:UvrD-helicase domain-containing protein [Clostridia bacterium]